MRGADDLQHSNWIYVAFIVAGLFLTRACDMAQPSPAGHDLPARCSTEYGLEPC
jgi:hypothetical protein